LYYSLIQSYSRFNRERSKSHKEIQLLLKALEAKQGSKDTAMMAAIEELISETLESFQDVMNEVELLEMLEEIIASIPVVSTLINNVSDQPAIPLTENKLIEEEKEYTILNIKKQVVPPPPVQRVYLEEDIQQPQSITLLAPSQPNVVNPLNRVGIEIQTEEPESPPEPPPTVRIFLKGINVFKMPFLCN
jgi:hypothetical protein